MRTWRRAVIGLRCGSCGAAIAIGAPFVEFAIAGLARRKVRCPACAGDRVPADLPPLPTRPAPAWAPLVPIPVGAHVLPLDWKARSAGEREPGQEG
jgi:hypothetical protein